MPNEVYHCPECGQVAQPAYRSQMFVPGAADVAKCQNVQCNTEFVTDDAKRIKDIADKKADFLDDSVIPVAAKRAIGLASAIYGMSTHGEDIQASIATLEDYIGKTYGTQYAGKLAFEQTELKRSFLNITDSRVGVLVLGISGKNWDHVYVVFRGSRSDAGDLNPLDAGWAKDSNGSWVNLDWNANYTNQQEMPPWASLPVKVHGGFLHVYKSVMLAVNSAVQSVQSVLRAKRSALGQSGSDVQVIVTGHSLGAGLAVLCAYQMEANGICSPFCYPFCTPRVGNLAFAEKFLSLMIYGGPRQLDPEGPRLRCINFTRERDKVSTEGDTAFKSKPGEKLQRTLNSRGGSDGLSAMLGVITKAVHGMRKPKDKRVRFYQTQPHYILSTGGKLVGVPELKFLSAHDYTGTQSKMLGNRLFKT